MEERLISLLITRIYQELPINKGKLDFRKDEVAQQNEKALIELSPFKLSFIIYGMIQIIDKISKGPQVASELVSKSHYLVLELIVNCLSHEWDHIRTQFSNLLDVRDELERIRIKEKEEAILPPPLEDRVSKELFKILHYFVSKPQPAFQTEIQEIAAKGLYQISASNYETIITSVTQYLSPNINCSEEEVISQITLLEYFNLNAKHLSEFLLKLGKVLAGFKKVAIQIAIANVLRKVIWNWINRYPFEFVTLCQSGTRLPGNPEALFDIFDSWSSSTSKKINFWPVCTMLLVLCPEIMLRIVVNTNTIRKEDKSKEEFLSSLYKALKNSKLADISSVCYIDLCKASTYVSKSDISALRYIIPSIEVELAERIFPKEVVKIGDGLIDEGMFVDYLHSAFLLSPRKAMNSLFAECLKAGGPTVYKRVLVKTLLRIGTDQHSLPWNPSLPDVYSLHSGNLRLLFQELLTSVREISTLTNNNDKKSKQQMEKVVADMDILEKIITLYKVDPLLSFYPSKTPDLEEIRLLFMGLCECVAFFHLPALSDRAYETLLALYKPEYIGKWYTKDPIEGCWLISSSVNSYLSSILIDQVEMEQIQIQKVFGLLEQILKKKNQFIESYKDAQPTDSTKRIRSQATTKLEVALLIHFCSGNTEIVSTCALCLTLLCTEAELIRQYIDESDNALLANFDAYKRLGNSGILCTGRQAQQKAIRTALKRVERHTPGNYAAWEAVFQRWQMYTSVLLLIEESIVDNKLAKMKEEARRRGLPKTIIEKTHADVLQEWNNFLGLLCSLAAVTINQDLKKQSKSGADQILEAFINELMEYLVSDYLSVRETVKMTLGNALSPSAYPVLFQVLHNHAKNIFGKDGQGNFSANSILFVDQAVSIIKLIIDGDLGNDSLSLFTSDFEDLVITLIRFVRQLTISVNSLQTKHKLCGFLEGIMSKSSLLTFRNEYKFRNSIIENIMEWTSEFSTKESNIPQDLPSATHKQIVKLIKELDVQVLQAISCLIRGLPLQGKDDEEKSNAFSKIFQFFTNLLTRCKKNPQSVLTPQLPESTIQSLSYLVTANIEHGLEYFVTMGYHDDYETRSAFLKVLTNILNEGTDFDMEAVSLNKYYKLSELIFEPNLEVILNVCDNTPITEADAISQLLIRIFESNEKTMDLLKVTITQEVNKTDTANTLFRRNSMATKLMAAYCKLNGRQYLKLTLGPVLRELQQQPFPSELNPTLLPPGQDIIANQKNVQMICEKFLTAIANSVPQCALPFREICHFLKQVVSDKFPGAAETAIAGFIFLRFLCPAIVAPDGFGVISGDLQDKELRRCLVIVTKILQNLANRVYFVKEPFMECMNGFIESNLPIMNKILEEFTMIPSDPTQLTPIHFSEEQIEEDMGRLHYFISISLEKLSNNWVAVQNGNSLFDKFTSVLSQLGPPPEPSNKVNNTNYATIGSAGNSKNQNIHYQQFLNRMSKLDTDNPRFKDIFYSHGKSKKGLPVLYYIARNFSSDIDTEHLFFHILKTSQQYLSQPYCIVIDLSMFSPENQIQIPWCGTFAKIFPDFGSVNLDTVYFINPNNWFKKYSNRIGKFVSRQQKKVHFCHSVIKLFDFISESECGLPPDTLSLERNVQSTFSHVIKEGKYSKKEVVIRISTDLLQVITTKQYSMFSHSTSLIDLIHVSTIIEISSVKENQFVVNISGKRSLFLVSLSAEQILQQLNASLDRYRLLHQNSQPKRAKAFRPSDVPGTLLNMALLNLTVLSHSLRIAAYNLLVSLCSSFQFSIPSNFLEATDIAIPKNRRHFVMRISEELSSAEKHLTLEFLLESLHSVSKADYRSKVMVLDYMKPWISNLAANSVLSNNQESIIKIAKTKEILNELLEIHIQDEQLAPAILTKVWKVIGAIPELIDLILNCIYDKCITLKNPLGSKTMDAIEDIMITLASRNAQLVSGKIIHQLLSILRDTGNQFVDRIENHSHWVKIEVFIRFILVLSCENLICVEIFLPELFYIIIITFFSGTSLFRANIHALFMNIVHSIFSSRICHEEKLQTLRFHINDFQQLQNRLHFGIGNQVDTSPFGKSPSQEKLENMPISMVENVTTSLINVLNCCTNRSTCLDTARHARWLSLTTVGAFTPNFAIQPRSISALGVLCRSSSLVTEDLLTNLISLLRTSLVVWSSKEDKIEKGSVVDMTTSIINCLSRLYEYIDINSKYYSPLFWVAISLVQIHDQKIFTSAVTLLESIIHTMFEHNSYKGQGLSNYCMEARNGSWKPMLHKLDQISGISFTHNFSYSVAGHLLKGLKNPSTKAVTTRVLSSFVDLCRENNPANIMGYLSALLPVKGDDIGNLRQTIMAASGEAGNYQSLFNPTLIPDKMHGALLFTFLVTILKSSDFEHEQQYIYKTLEEGITYMPDAFPVTFEVLIPKMQQVLNSSQNLTILLSSLSITHSIFHYGLDVATNYAQLTKQYMQTIGFPGLPESDQFMPVKNRPIFIQVICDVIEAVLSS